MNLRREKRYPAIVPQKKNAVRRQLERQEGPAHAEVPVQVTHAIKTPESSFTERPGSQSTPCGPTSWRRNDADAQLKSKRRKKGQKMGPSPELQDGREGSFTSRTLRDYAGQDSSTDEASEGEKETDDETNNLGAESILMAGQAAAASAASEDAAAEAAERLLDAEDKEADTTEAWNCEYGLFFVRGFHENTNVSDPFLCLPITECGLLGDKVEDLEEKRLETIMMQDGTESRACNLLLLFQDTITAERRSAIASLAVIGYWRLLEKEPGMNSDAMSRSLKGMFPFTAEAAWGYLPSGFKRRHEQLTADSPGSSLEVRAASYVAKEKAAQASVGEEVEEVEEVGLI